MAAALDVGTESVREMWAWVGRAGVAAAGNDEDDGNKDDAAAATSRGG